MEPQERRKAHEQVFRNLHRLLRLWTSIYSRQKREYRLKAILSKQPWELGVDTATLDGDTSSSASLLLHQVSTS